MAQTEYKFIQLIMMLSQLAWQNLGKISNPMTGKAEKNLSMAKEIIDTLIILKAKTEGHLSPEEEKFLSNAIADLQMNYVAEEKDEKPEGKDEQKEKEK